MGQVLQTTVCLLILAMSWRQYRTMKLASEQAGW